MGVWPEIRCWFPGDIAEAYGDIIGAGVGIGLFGAPGPGVLAGAEGASIAGVPDG